MTANLPVSGALFMIGLVAGLCLSRQVPAEVPSVLVSTVPVTEQEVNDTLTTFGVLDPDPDEVLSLSLPHAGLINRVWVRLGQRVKSGDKLLEVVTAPDARMQYLQARSAVDYARRELQRQERLLADQLATRAQVDAARKSLRDAQATLDAFQQRGMDVAAETLRAPRDGIITRLDVSQGQRVLADSAAMLIAAEQRLIARLGVEPEDLASVRAGAPVTVQSVFVPGVRVESQVREIHAMIDPGTHLVEVLVPIPEQHVDQLVLGSRVRGRIQLSSYRALVVPRSAVLGRDAKAHVFIVTHGKAKRVAVQAGAES
ncbi:MAG: efflux RND transporter periplasmic adaptor subunit, partial [Gammaproteobacteria bacterium]